MSTLNLDEIRARAEAATTGPWWAWDRGVGWHIATGDQVEGFDEYGRPRRYLPEGDRTDIGREADAEFIAHAREDIPALLVEVERLTAARDRYVADVANLREQLRYANIALAEIEEVGPRCEHC